MPYVKKEVYDELKSLIATAEMNVKSKEICINMSYCTVCPYKDDCYAINETDLEKELAEFKEKL